MKNPAIVMIDVFSILAISVFVLYTVSSGRSSSEEVPSVCIVNIRLAADIPLAQQKEWDFPPYLSQMVTFDVKSEAGSFSSTVHINKTAVGLEIILEDPDNVELKLVVDEVLDDRILGMKIIGEAEVLGSKTTKIKGRIGNWHDPTILNDCHTM